MGFGSGHLARVVLRATKASSQIVTTLHYDLSGNVIDSAPSLQALADRIRDDVLGPWGACITPDWQVQPVEVLDEKDPLSPTAVRDAATSGVQTAGTRLAPPSSEVVPIQLCGMATLHTAHIGRSFRGRMYTPPIWSDASMSDGQLAGSQLTNFQALVASIPLEPDLSSGSSTAAANLCVYSRTRRALNASAYAEHVTSITLATTVRWLRSRAL